MILEACKLKRCEVITGPGETAGFGEMARGVGGRDGCPEGPLLPTFACASSLVSTEQSCQCIRVPML